MKTKTQFVCNSCGAISARWAGKCSSCGEWNQISEEVAKPIADNANRYSWTGAEAKLTRLSELKNSSYKRVSVGLEELDRVLGGGLVEGSVVLIGGDPGVGKSTILMQVMSCVSRHLSAVYFTGEESEGQTKMRADRLGVPESADIQVATVTELQEIIRFIHSSKAGIVVIDSIQTMFSASLTSAPGSVAQVRECAAQLTRVAKTYGITVLLIGHVTKEGELAGPRVLEHIVDAVLYFEGEAGSSFRMLRAIKNRFGGVNELGVFSMEETGLVDVNNPSSMFLTNHDTPVCGSCVTVAMEGNRPFLVEIQALVEHTVTPNPKRAATGLEVNRVNLMLAVLNRHLGVDASDKNVYVKVVGGIKLQEPAADLALLVALYSSLRNIRVPKGLCVFGEAGLVGEIRAVSNAEARLKEASKLGFTDAIFPMRCALKKAPPALALHQISTLPDLTEALKFK